MVAMTTKDESKQKQQYQQILKVLEFISLFRYLLNWLIG